MTRHNLLNIQPGDYAYIAKPILNLEADAKFASEAALDYVEKCAKGNVLAVVFHFRNITAFLVNAFGKLFLGKIKLLAGTSYLEPYTQRLKFILQAVTLRRTYLAIILGLDLVEGLYIFLLLSAKL